MENSLRKITEKTVSSLTCLFAIILFLLCSGFINGVRKFELFLRGRPVSLSLLPPASLPPRAATVYFPSTQWTSLPVCPHRPKSFTAQFCLLWISPEESCSWAGILFVTYGPSSSGLIPSPLLLLQVCLPSYRGRCGIKPKCNLVILHHQTFRGAPPYRVNSKALAMYELISNLGIFCLFSRNLVPLWRPGSLRLQPCKLLSCHLHNILCFFWLSCL